MRCNLTNCTNEGFNSFHLSPFFLIRNFIKKDLANYRGISNQIRILRLYDEEKANIIKRQGRRRGKERERIERRIPVHNYSIGSTSGIVDLRFITHRLSNGSMVCARFNFV